MLNERQKAFVEYFAACGNAAEAARRAGYSEKTARQQGERLLTKADIQEKLGEISNRLSGERLADAEEVKAYLTSVMRSGTEKTSDRLKAGAQLLRAAGPVSPARTEQDSTIQTEGSGATVVALPYNGHDPARINAFLRPDGEVIPLAGHENDDILIYVALRDGGWEDLINDK